MLLMLLYFHRHCSKFKFWWISKNVFSINHIWFFNVYVQGKLKFTSVFFFFLRITDAMNDTKDKVKYLESLRRHFDQLYQDATPASIINNAIPGIVNSVRQMDSISRYYARTGFLGIVFTKITNQLVLACKEYIKNCTITAYDGDELWVRIKEEIRNRDSLPVVDPQQRLLRNQVEAKIKVIKDITWVVFRIHVCKNAFF